MPARNRKQKIENMPVSKFPKEIKNQEIENASCQNNSQRLKSSRNNIPKALQE